MTSSGQNLALKSSLEVDGGEEGGVPTCALTWKLPSYVSVCGLVIL